MCLRAAAFPNSLVGRFAAGTIRVENPVGGVLVSTQPRAATELRSRKSNAVVPSTESAKTLWLVSEKVFLTAPTTT
jgi:hypothetical protein